MERAAQWVRAWKPEVLGIHEVFHARFVDHAYPSHTHDAWTVFTVDEGAIAYDLERRHRGVAGPKVTLLPPGVVHDGRPGASAGYRKRVLYVGADVGFHDQAHFTRHFKRHVGTTPGRFARSGAS